MVDFNVDNLKTVLNPRDQGVLDAQSGTNWVPKKPRELLLAYIEQDKEVDRTSLDFRRQKAKEVYDGYGEMIDKCRKLEEDIKEECKSVKVTLNPSSQLNIIDAVKRVFPGYDGTVITFEMYKVCIDALAASSNANIPKPGDKG